MRTLKTDTGTEVRLSGEEFIYMLEHHLGHSVSGFVITNPDPSPTGKIMRQAIVHPLDKTNFIDNVKSLRESVKSVGRYLMLADARWALENWEQWLHFVDKYNRLPVGGYGSGDDRGKLV